MVNLLWYNFITLKKEKKLFMNKLKLTTVILFTTFTAQLLQANIFDEFKNQFQQTYVDPFNKDLTGVICSNVFTKGDNLGWFTLMPPSLGINIKISAVAKKVSPDNVIVNTMLSNQSIKLIPFFVLQVEKGLPLNIDIIARYSGYENFTFYGIGVKYKILSLPPLVPVLNLSIAAGYNKLEAKNILQHTSQSVNAIISVDKLPFLQPYITAGVDFGELNVSNEVFPGGMKSKFSSGTRIEGGIKFSFIPFIFININYAQIYNTEGYGINFGIKF